MVFFDLAILLVFTAILVKSSDIVIINAIRLSNILKINQAAVGFIFIAISTSLPEITIGILSALNGNSLLSVGNVIGANITLMTLVIGIMAFFGFNLGIK